jgi:hypothetical protein
VVKTNWRRTTTLPVASLTVMLVLAIFRARKDDVQVQHDRDDVDYFLFQRKRSLTGYECKTRHFTRYPVTRSLRQSRKNENHYDDS